MATYNLGRFILNVRGSYSSSATYNKLDVVLYSGSSYICKADSTTNKVPTNTTYWQLLAQAGQAVMTPEQQQDIINTLLNQGVIIDPNYNTYTTEEKTKLAGLSVPQNGQLVINYGNSRIGTFTANQSGNKTVNIPSPNDGAVKFVMQDDPNTTIGTFTANQKEDVVIEIPVRGGGTANNGQLTIQQGGTTIGTFTANQSTNTTVNIPNNTLNIQKNGNTVGSYTPSNASTINITVPTNVSDLNDGGNYPTYRGYSSNDNNTTGDALDGVCKIDKLKSNYVYYCSNCKGLEIDNYEYDATKPDCYVQPVTYIYVEAIDDFTVDLTNLTNYRQINDGNGLSLHRGSNYLITVFGDTFRVDELV